MSPNTATALKESKRNQIKDFLHVAGPLGVTHFLLLTATHNASYLRIAKCASAAAAAAAAAGPGVADQQQALPLHVIGRPCVWARAAIKSVSKPGRQACHQPATHLMPLLRGKRIEKPVAKILVRMQRKSACTSSTMLPCGSLIHLRGRSRPVILKAVGWAG